MPSEVLRRFPLLLLALSTLTASLPARGDDGWKAVAIPEGWKRQPGGIYAPNGGFAWFRCTVEVPDSWRGSDLELYVESIDDAREFFFNGQRLGGFGDFPPRFRSGLGQESHLTIAAKHVRPGARNLLAVRTCRRDGRGGFNVAAPVLFGKEAAIRTHGNWQVRSGDDAKWAAQADVESLPSFAKIENAEEVAKTLKRLQNDDGPLSPEASLARFNVADDLAAQIALADPHIGQPLSIKWDERGRLWVLEYLQYPNPAGLKMVSRDKYLRTVYDKVPPPPPNHFKGKDRISIHEDTDGDGVYDKHTAFVDDLSLASSFARGRGGVWVLNPPYLLFYPDRDNDDVPDGDPEVHLEGFGIEDSHSITNSLRWGPDGWLYATQGSTVTGNIRRYGSQDKPVHSMGQLVWRYHPESRRYEIFAEGGGNAFGVEFDAKGRVFSGHNGGNTRGFHYVQGGYFRKGFGKHGELSNPYSFGYFEHMGHHNVPRFTHTFVIYEGQRLPERYRGKLFGVAPLHSHVVYSQIEAKGATFKTKDLGHPLVNTDSWFRPVDIQAGPDGALYVADFYEQRIDHASHYQGRVHKESGRIYRLCQAELKPSAAIDYAKRTSDQLVDLLAHDNKWHRQQALRLLGDRKDKSVVNRLEEQIHENTGQLALESLWALNLCGGLSDEVALKTLEHADPYVRLWTVRLLCDDGQVTPQLATALIVLSSKEPSVIARSQLACSARRLPADVCAKMVVNLLSNSQDTHDPYMPLLLWWAIESKCKQEASIVLSMFQDDGVWDFDMVREHILARLMRRFAQAGTIADLQTCAKLLALAPKQSHADRLLAGFEKAFEGRTLSGLPDELVAAMAKAGGGSLALRLRQADTRAIDEALSVIGDEQSAANDRRQYIQILGQIDQPRCVPVLLEIVKQSKSGDVRRAALGALQSYDDAEIGAVVLQILGDLSGDTLDVAHALLASRQAWSLKLLAAVDGGEIKPAALPLPIVRKVLLHQDPQVATLVNKHWGSVQGTTTEEMLRDLKRIAAVIDEASGNPYPGRKLFAQHCGKCHQLFDQGGFVGPDLTAYQRSDLQRVLLNVVNPSIEIREGFENYVLYTTDGRVLNGFISDQNDKVVILRSTDGRSTVVPRDQIEEMSAVSRSVMPDGILKPLSDEQLRDLFAYLRSSQPLP